MDPPAAKRPRLDKVQEEPSILMLNDDCLYSVMGFLDIRDLLAVEKVCMRFKGLAERIIKTHKVLDFDQLARVRKVKAKEVDEIAERIGMNIHTLRASRKSFCARRGLRPWRIPRCILLYCNNLENVYLSGFRIERGFTSDKLRDVLKCVKVAEICQAELYDYDVVDLFEDFEHLSVLNLSNNYFLEGAHFLKLLRNITVLNLSSNGIIDSHYFVKFCKANPQLQSLNIRSCTHLWSESLESIAENLKELEHLVISTDYNANEDDYLLLASLPKLTKLHINDSHSMNIGVCEKFLEKISSLNLLEHLEIRHTTLSDRAIKSLSNLTHLKVLKLNCIVDCKDAALDSLRCTETLQELHIVCSKDTTEGSLERLLGRCQSLRYINMYMCTQMGMSFLHKAIQHVRNRRHVLEIVVKSTKIYCSLSSGLKKLDLSNIKLITKLSDEEKQVLNHFD